MWQLLDIKASSTARNHGADPVQAFSSNKHSDLGPELAFSGKESHVSDLEKALSEVLLNTKHSGGSLKRLF